MSVSRNGGRRHRWPRPSAVGRGIRPRWRGLGHVGLRRWHLSHAWRGVHRIWGRHPRRVRHRLHERSRHVSARGTRRRHTGHHWLCRISIRWISVDVSSSCCLCCRVLFVRRWRHRGRSRRANMRRMLRRLVLLSRWWEHLHVPFARVWPHRRNLCSVCDLVMLEWIEVVLDMHRGTFLDRPCSEKRIRSGGCRFAFRLGRHRCRRTRRAR